jgi:hypothetical protein
MSESSFQPPLSEPANRQELARWIEQVLGLRIPSQALCPGHQSPLDFLARSFLPPSPDGPGGQDLLVWANRGGGKTMLAAVASLLEGLYRRPVKIRILGGSFDQSDRLAEYLRDFLSREQLSDAVQGRMTHSRIRLAGQADIRMLAQSQRAVRGQHVQKMRCDEVDLFDPAVWRALQFVTRSSGQSRGAVEVFSTLHRPGGLMDQLVQQAMARAPGQGGFELVKWCLWEVIQRCPSERNCAGCPLEEDCQGKARQADGFFGIDDAIAIKARSSRSAWQAEMLCRGAKRDWAVFGEFDPAVHVGQVDYCPEWPVYRGIDLGYANPSVCLWMQTSPTGMVHVLREYARSHLTMEQLAVEIKGRDLGPVKESYIDPAGNARQSTSGQACTAILRAGGVPCISRSSTIAEGLELIRTALAPALGLPRLKVSPQCAGLIAAFAAYHYAEPSGGRFDESPVKDGPDHYIDALRYFFVNHTHTAGKTKRKTY